jgi:hypothetical protein
MKTLIAATALALASIGAHAAKTAKDEFCTSYAGAAEAIMTARQAGASMERMLAVSDNHPDVRNVTRELTINAFKVPRFSTDKFRADAVQDFRNAAHLHCLTN